MSITDPRLRVKWHCQQTLEATKNGICGTDKSFSYILKNSVITYLLVEPPNSLLLLPNLCHYVPLW